MGYGTDENDPLVSTINNDSKKEKVKNYSTSLCINRTFLFLLFALVISSSMYFNYQLQYIQETVIKKQTLKELHDLESQVSKQEIIIRRFNTTITNKDVLHQVNLLQEQLQDTEKVLNDNLKSVEDNVDVKLKNTMGELNNIVSKAQAEIQSEVDKVHHDVESYVRTTQDQFSMENSFMIYQLAGTFTLIGCLISMWHMTAHLRHFFEPSIQRKVLAILWMCPIYSVTSWLSLVFTQAEGYLGILKDFYEAYVIYTFLSFLIAVLGKGDRSAVVDLLTRHADHLPDPRICGFLCKMQYDSPRAKSELVLTQCQAFAMQFVFLKPTIAMARFICKKLEWHGLASEESSSMDPRSPQFYFLILDNISVFMAFSGLLKFYHAVHEDLSWCRPFPKFLCIKGVVFMTFWQGLAISILASTTQDFGDDVMQRKVNAEQWAEQAQDFLICLEMLLFSIAHFYVFPYEEWKEGYRPKDKEDGTTFIETMAMKDFVYDLKLVLNTGSGKKARQRSKKNKDDKSGSLINTIHEQDEDTVTSATSEDLESSNMSAKDDADDDAQQREAISRATTRLLSSRSLLKKLAGNEEMIQAISQDQEHDEEGGLVKIDKEDDSSKVTTTEESSSNVVIETNEVTRTRESLITEVETRNETTSLLDTTGPSNDAEEEKEETLNPSIFTSLGV